MERKPPPRKAPSGRTSGPLSPLKPPARISSQKKPRRPLEPGEAEWKRDRTGVCAGCGWRGKIRLHHVVREADIRKLATPEEISAGICWRIENAIGLGAPYVMGGSPDCQCHADHHARGLSDKRLPLSLVREPARAFAVELMGVERAWDYFEKHYRP